MLHPVPPEIRTNAAVLIELIRKGCEVPDGKEDTLLSVYHTVCSEKQEVKQEKQEKQEEAIEWMEEEEEEHLDVMKQLLQEGAARYPLAVQGRHGMALPCRHPADVDPRTPAVIPDPRAEQPPVGTGGRRAHSSREGAPGEEAERG